MKNLLSISICLLCIISCKAQSIGKQLEKQIKPQEKAIKETQKSMQRLEQLPTNELQLGDEPIKYSVVIYNNSNQNLTVLIFDSLLKNDTVKLMANKDWISPMYSSNPSIKIQTENQYVTYTLERGSKYIIFWNHESKYWDMTKTN